MPLKTMKTANAHSKGFFSDISDWGQSLLLFRKTDWNDFFSQIKLGLAQIFSGKHHGQTTVTETFDADGNLIRVEEVDKRGLTTTTTFDAETGAKTSVTETKRDGRIIETLYDAETGVRTSVTVTDGADNRSWETKEKIYDDDGRLAQFTYTFDNGRVVEQRLRNIDPDAADDATSTASGAAVAVDVLANDIDRNGDVLAVDSFTQGALGTVTLDDNGTADTSDDQLIYTASAGVAGTDSFTYTVSDGDGGTDTAKVTVTVTNEAPELSVEAAVSVEEGTTEVAAMIAGTDAEGDTLTYSIAGGADAELFTIDANTGALSFVAAPDFDTPADAGEDNTYEVVIGLSDGVNPTVTQSVAVTVTEAPVVGPERETVAFDLVGSASQGLTSYTNFAPTFSSAGDGFGVYQVGVSGSIPFSLLDDSAGVFASDSLGIIDSAANLDAFFGATDTVNSDTTGPVSATWVFDISGYADLGLNIDFGAMGDFESSDTFTVSYSIDGGETQVAFDFTADEDDSQTYTLAGGAVEVLDDPLVETLTGTTLSNMLQTLSASIEGSGSELALTVTADTNGGSEAFAMQNITIDGVAQSVTGVIAFDMVDGTSRNLTGTATTAPTFSSPGDGFGIFQVGVGSVPFSLLDDSAGVFAADTLGIVDSATNFGTFFGATDTVNSDNTDPVSYTWSFDVSGATDLSLAIDAGAMGDFESSDVFSIAYSIDGAEAVTLFDFTADEAAAQSYTLAGGTVVSLDDPLIETTTGVSLTNVFQTLEADLAGTGSTLEVIVTADTNGGTEAFALQNLLITGTTVGGGTPVAPTYAVATSDTQGFEGSSFAFTVTRSGDTSVAGSVEYTIGGDVDADDISGALAGTVDFAAGQTSATVTVNTLDDDLSEALETLSLTLSNPVEGTITTASASVSVQDNDTITLISAVQGAGDVSGFVGQDVTVSAIVTYTFRDGFFVQEEVTDSDGNPITSEGIFVFTNSLPSVSLGDLVQVTGGVSERFDRTQITATDIVTVSSGNAIPDYTSISLDPASAPNFESLEGMLVSVDSGTSDPLTLITNFNLDRFGEFWVSAGGQTQPTQLFDAQTELAEVQALMEANENARLLIDDGSSTSNPTEFQYIPNTTDGDNGNGYLDAGDTFTADGATFRIGTEFTAPLTGVMDYAFSEYRLQLDEMVQIDESTNSGARPVDAPDVGGNVQVASFNVLNFFTSLSDGEANNPAGQARGAASEADLMRQAEKLANAILDSGAEVVALQELENNGAEALTYLLSALEGEAVERGVADQYDWSGVATDAETFSGPYGDDAITTGVIYNAAAVALNDADYHVFDEPSGAVTAELAGLSADQFNRPAIGATFTHLDTGETFTVVSVHFKSKGDSGLASAVSAADAAVAAGTASADQIALLSDPNVDQGNGQGYWNQVRTDAAEELMAWLEGTNADPADNFLGTGVENGEFLILGDFNAYAEEDPTQVFSDDADYVDLLEFYVGTENAYSYVFDGQAGALDQAIATDDLALSITGAAEWHINAAEPDLLSYSSAFNDERFYSDDVFAASDHDPVIVGLQLETAVA